MAKERKKKNRVNPLAGFTGKTIDLAKFNLKSDKEQYEIIKKTLEEIYQDDLDVTKKHIMKVLNLTYSPKDDYIYLPYDLKVSKEKLDLNFYVVKKPLGLGWLLFGILLLLFALIGSTYIGITYIQMSNLNKDIDKDGIPDINLDLNNDRKADINIDNNNDNKPDLNIDYKGDHKSVFNIDTNGDGKPDSNLVNDASTPDKLKECTINCDINGDGWPDINLDLDGDGKPDTDIDTDGDGVADLNIDLNGDRVCDIMCDTDDDNKCDLNCINTEYNGIHTGTSTMTGDNNAATNTPMLVLRFVDGKTVNVDNLVPNDQPLSQGQEIPKPIKSFSVENLSDYSLEYSLKMVVNYNTFISNNFQYKMSGTNGAPSFDWRIVPKADVYIAEKVLIPPRATQNYELEYVLVGTNKPQNEDQNRSFRATFEIETE